MRPWLCASFVTFWCTRTLSCLSQPRRAAQPAHGVAAATVARQQSRQACSYVSIRPHCGERPGPRPAAHACSQAIAGGHTTRDLGNLSKTGGHEDGGTAEGVTRPFTEEVVSYKHGDNVILHQWAGGGDLLVNCQSPTPQSFICQVRARACRAPPRLSCQART